MARRTAPGGTATGRGRSSQRSLRPWVAGIVQDRSRRRPADTCGAEPAVLRKGSIRRPRQRRARCVGVEPGGVTTVQGGTSGRCSTPWLVPVSDGDQQHRQTPGPGRTGCEPRPSSARPVRVALHCLDRGPRRKARGGLPRARTPPTIARASRTNFGDVTMRFLRCSPNGWRTLRHRGGHPYRSEGASPSMSGEDPSIAVGLSLDLTVTEVHGVDSRWPLIDRDSPERKRV